jgi:predicted DCC family thiol-disulfide oxidoreductase YuxK
MSEPAVLLFDGVCNLCNGTVRFVAERDPVGRFHFAALQSDKGRELLARCGLPLDALDTFVLVEGDRCWTRSDAALRVARGLSGAWPLLAVLRLVPRFLRDRVYGWVAGHRYAWFGKQESCMVPSPELRSRFL